MNYLDQKRIESCQLNMTIAYLLWAFLGFFGAHRLYCKKPYGIAILILEIVGLFTLIVAIGIIPLFIVFIWWLIDSVQVFKWVNEYNLKLVEQYYLDSRVTNQYQAVPISP